jgi:hypothetical protein
MDQCSKCKFYKGGIVPFSKTVCTKIPNVRPHATRVKYFELPLAFKICKGYFFEHKDSDLYKTKDDSLSGEYDI